MSNLVKQSSRYSNRFVDQSIGDDNNSLFSTSAINENLDTSDGDKLIWNIDNQYNFVQSPTSFYAVSDNASDNNVTLLIQYINKDYDLIRKFVKLNGQTPVLISDDCLRVNDSLSFGANKLQGDAYILTSTDVTDGVPNDLNDIVSYIEARHQRQLQSLFTVPRHKRLILIDASLSTSKGKDALFILKITTPDSIQELTSTLVSLFESTTTINFYPRAISEKSDVYFLASTENSNSLVTCRIQYMFTDL